MTKSKGYSSEARFHQPYGRVPQKLEYNLGLSAWDAHKKTLSSKKIQNQSGTFHRHPKPD